jgi:hypothetical protein
MDEKYKIYCKKISDDLKNASRDNPKHFWKILGGHKRKQQPNIEINTLYDFFKDLNTKGPDEQQSTTLQNELPNDSNVHINGYISQKFGCCFLLWPPNIFQKCLGLSLEAFFKSSEIFLQ